MAPGSVRQARLEAGLTLAQLAGAELSRAAIHQIEHGRSRPSMRTLEHIVERTGKPASFFLARTAADLDHDRLSYAGFEELDRLSLQGQHSRILELVPELLAKTSDLGDRAFILFHLGRSNVQLNHGESALEALRESLRLFVEAGDPWMTVAAMDQEACALYLLDDPSSVSRAELALEKCRRLEPMPPMLESRILGNLASMHVARRSWKKAVHFYEACLTAAEPVRNLRHMAIVYDGLGMAYHRLGDNRRAVAAANKSLALYSMEAESAAVARAENNLGDLLTRTGDYVGAEHHLVKSLHLCEQLGLDRRGKAYALNSLAELHFRRNRHGQARREAKEAQRLAATTGERIPLGMAAQIQAKIAAAAGDMDSAAEYFTIAINVFAELKLVDRQRECRIEFGQALEAADRLHDASRQWKAAAYLGTELAPTVVPFEVYLTESSAS